jgi:hypothetical protein
MIHHPFRNPMFEGGGVKGPGNVGGREADVFHACPSFGKAS